MKTLILILFISCSHAEYNFHKTKGIANSVRPYVENFKLNHEAYAKVAPGVQFPVNFYAPLQTVGVCYLRDEIKDREVLINPKIWDEYPEKRQYIVDYLLSVCYGANARKTSQYEFHLNRL